MDSKSNILLYRVLVIFSFVFLYLYNSSDAFVICTRSFDVKTAVQCQPTAKFNQLDNSSFQTVTQGLILQLNASDCGIYKIDLKVFAPMLSITHLDLSNNYLVNLNGIAALVELLDLDISGNVFIGPTHVRMVANHPKLTHLNLRNNPVNIYNTRVLNWSLALTKLDISSNDLTNINYNFFEKSVNIQELNISSNRISVLHPNIFNHLDNLTVLDLCDNQLRTLPASIFSKNHGLLRLDLSGNSLNSIAVTTFHSTPRITHLLLSRNQLSISIWYVIEKLTELKELHLENNRIDELLTSSAQFPMLNHLSLACNNLEYFPMDFFEVYSTLKTFSYYGNPWKCTCLLQILITMENKTVDILDNDRNLKGMFPACIMVNEEQVCMDDKVKNELLVSWLDNGGSVPCNWAQECEQFIDIK